MFKATSVNGINNQSHTVSGDQTTECSLLNDRRPQFFFCELLNHEVEVETALTPAS